MIRGICYWFFGILITVLFFIYACVTVPFHRRRLNRYLHRLIRIWMSFLLRFLLGVRTREIGADRFDRDRAYVIVSNHRSYTDILIGNATVPLQFRWLAKESLFRIPIIGQGMRWAGYVPIAREHSRAASRSLERMREVIAGGVSVWIFPEGTRTRKEELGRFKRGAFTVAAKTGTPILPITIFHSDSIFLKPLVVRGRDVVVEYHEPVTPAAIDEGQSLRQEEERLSSRVREIIQTSYTRHATATSG
jgi:1-acyl-sn-glycerol-3-phosphate acyltransferase